MTRYSPDTGGHLGPSDRATLSRLADQLIPQAHGMPSASQVDATGDQLDAVLASRPDLEPLLLRAVALDWGEDLVAGLEGQRRTDPEAVDALTFAVVAAYYLHPRVRSLIGYSGQQALPVDIGPIPPYLREDLLDPVVDRGPRYRDVPQ